MEFFTRYHNNISIGKDLLALIKCSKPKNFTIRGISYKLFTYTLNIKKHENEDDVYAKNPDLIGILPRACSLLVLSDSSEPVLAPLMGPYKFAGKSGIDEDPDNEADETVKDSGIFDFAKVLSWAENKSLEIVETVKENGKFWIYRYTKDGIILCGSKNNHIAFLPEEIDRVIEENKSNDIMFAGLNDIKANLDKLTSPAIREFFNQGYSLVGELCDGQHFFPHIPGQGAIKYFGFFKNGAAMETMGALALLQSLAIETVDFKVVFSPESDPSTLNDIFKLSRCMNSEGAVLRCRNVETGETILVKSKSAKYIVWRMFRQVLLRGYKEIEYIKKRFVDTASYHGLNTAACARIVRQLMDFGLWMISKEYPCSIVGHMPVQSVRGKLPNGFCTYWAEYLEASHAHAHAHANTDIDVTIEDFGPFDASEFLSNPDTNIYEKRTPNDPTYVFFVQGLQGSGKSTTAAKLCERLNALGITAVYREQDTYWGDTASCQGAIYHDISRADGPKVVIISRCNANPTQYERYLQMLYKLPCVVSFIAPEKIDSLYLMISLSGIINRSTLGDSLMVGRFEYPISQVIEFTRKNFVDFQTHPLAWTISSYRSDDVGALGIEASESKTDSDIQTWVQTHYQELHGLRLPINTIVDQMLDIVEKTMGGNSSRVVYNQTPIYVGVAVSPGDKQILQNWVDQNHPTTGSFTSYIHHCTLEFGGGKKKVSADQVKPTQTVTGIVDALVIRKSDNASAFRLSSLMVEDRVVKLDNQRVPHITAKIPSSSKPMCSNEFVGSTDKSVVTIIPFSHTLMLNCFYSS